VPPEPEDGMAPRPVAEQRRIVSCWRDLDAGSSHALAQAFGGLGERRETDVDG
jgi:hypothetical protein